MIISEIMSNALFIQRVLTTLFLQKFVLKLASCQTSCARSWTPSEQCESQRARVFSINHNVLVFLASIDEIVFRWMDDI